MARRTSGSSDLSSGWVKVSKSKSSSKRRSSSARRSAVRKRKVPMTKQRGRRKSERTLSSSRMSSSKGKRGKARFRRTVKKVAKKLRASNRRKERMMSRQILARSKGRRLIGENRETKGEYKIRQRRERELLDRGGREDGTTKATQQELAQMTKKRMEGEGLAKIQRILKGETNLVTIFDRLPELIRGFESNAKQDYSKWMASKKKDADIKKTIRRLKIYLHNENSMRRGESLSLIAYNSELRSYIENLEDRLKEE